MRFFIDLRDSDQFVVDGDGIEYDSAQDAIEEAAKTACAMAEDGLPERGGGEISLTLRDQDGPIAVINVALSVHILKATN